MRGAPAPGRASQWWPHVASKLAANHGATAVEAEIAAAVSLERSSRPSLPALAVSGDNRICTPIGQLLDLAARTELRVTSPTRSCAPV